MSEGIRSDKLPPTYDPRCGTTAGGCAHRKRKESPCKPCAEASHQYFVEWRARNADHVRAANAKWREDHPEQDKASKKKYCVANREKIRAKQAERRKTNPARAKRCKATPEQIKARKAEYRRTHREEINAYTRAYRKKNPEGHRRTSANWIKANPQKANAHGKKWRLANPEKMRAFRADWRRANTVKIRGYTRERRALKLSIASEKYTCQEILDIYGSDCHLCGKPIDLSAPRRCGFGKGWELGLHLDHLIPLINGGNDLKSNIRPSHALCNISRPHRAS